MIETDYKLVDVLAETQSPTEDIEAPHYTDEAFASWLLGKVTTDDGATEASLDTIESSSDESQADEAGDVFIQMINAASRD